LILLSAADQKEYGKSRCEQKDNQKGRDLVERFGLRPLGAALGINAGTFIFHRRHLHALMAGDNQPSSLITH